MMDATFCPATMCPLFAADGSTLSGAVNATCEREACRWFDGTICQAGRVAIGEVAMASAGEGGSWPRLSNPMHRRAFDCPRERECTWQQQSPGGLCAPRRALAHGLDPRHCR